MLNFLLWYLVLSLFGLAALPLGWTWFRALPDRGWGLLRPLGLLLAGVALWLAGSFGLLRLNAGSALGGLALVAGVGSWALARWGGGWPVLRAWLRENYDLVLWEELLFLAALAFWVWYRIHDAEGIQYTERPMDFALFRAILRGGELPPGDPWMSGFAISYYYLGYLIMAMVTALSGVVPGIAFNLSLASLAALTSGAAFTVALGTLWERVRPRVALPLALLAVLLILGISNLTGVANTAYHKGMWPNEWFPPLKVNDLAISESGGRNNSVWWWWASSRTVSDYGPDGGRIEIIDEFPFFSFMLGDMHPHVLALPFATLAIGIALNALRASCGALPRTWRVGGGPDDVPEGEGGLSDSEGGLPDSHSGLPDSHSGLSLLMPPEAWGMGRGFGLLTMGLTALVVGAMAMLNTWDFPTQFALLAAVWLVALAPTLRREGRRWLIPLGAGLGALALLALALYLPFYIGFRSQADGIRLSQWATAPQHYLLMFGLFLLVAAPFALSVVLPFARERWQRPERGEAAWRLAGILLGMTLLSALLLVLLTRWLPITDGRLALLVALLWVAIPLGASLLMPSRSALILFWQLAAVPAMLAFLWDRWTLVLVALLLSLVGAALLYLVGGIPTEAEEREASAERRAAYGDARFPLLLVALALLLTMGPEIFYLKDYFGGRMNTIFKLYYQGWLLFALAVPFALAWLAQRWRGWSLLVIAPIALLTVASLWYPIESLRTKTNNFAQARWDGTFWLDLTQPDLAAAIHWLDAQPGTRVVLEAPGGSYNATQSALSAFTGHSTPLGWTGHESQWRGDSAEIVAREPVIRDIYTNPDPAAVLAAMEEYHVDFLAVTDNERARYDLTESQVNRFRDFLTPVFEQGRVVLFAR